MQAENLPVHNLSHVFKPHQRAQIGPQMQRIENQREMTPALCLPSGISCSRGMGPGTVVAPLGMAGYFRLSGQCGKGACLQNEAVDSSFLSLFRVHHFSVRACHQSCRLTHAGSTARPVYTPRNLLVSPGLVPSILLFSSACRAFLSSFPSCVFFFFLFLFIFFNDVCALFFLSTNPLLVPEVEKE